MRAHLASFLLAAFVLGSAQGGDSITLRLKPKKGTTYVFETVQETAAQGAAGPKNVSTNSMKVLQSDGKTIKLQSTIDKIESKQPGVEALKGMKTVMTLTPLYKFVSITSAGGGAAGKAAAQNVEMAMKMTPSFPQQAIRPGYSWSMPVDFKAMMSKMSAGAIVVEGPGIITFKVTFARLDRKAGKATAVLKINAKSTLNVTAQGQKLKIDFDFAGENVVDVASGMATSTSATVKQGMSGTRGSGTMTSKSTTRLLSMK